MCTGEWIDTTLSEVIDTYPKMYNWELVIMESSLDDAELYYLGEIDIVFDKYKDYYVFYTDEDSQQVQLEGDLISLEGFDVDAWE